MPSDLTPFPRPGERLEGGSLLASTEGLPSGYQSLLRDTLKLTGVARIAFNGLLALGLLAGLAGTAAALYNVESGIDPDAAGSLQIGFAWIVVAMFEVVALGIVAGLNGAFLGVRWLIRRSNQG
ncbi:MAG TPA: hypothetical protein VIK66_07870 [Gaiellaceae bacterium]